MIPHAFIEYVLSFYGHGEIYDIGATRDEVLLATGARMGSCMTINIPFEGDTIDREAVRDIILYMREKALEVCDGYHRET